ncbi:MAG TPA: hypothetical protein VFY24_02720 [Azospira sp.]|nr:hypothetical protein [Azospira sp.]
MLALLIVVLGGLSLIVGQLSAADARQSAERATAAALARAREALLGRAASDDNRPGSLPCPAPDAGGQAALFVGSRCPSTIGRYPWRTMKTGELRDGYGELLWYALSPTLRDHPQAEPINARTVTELRVDDRAGIAAVILAPGPALGGQGGRPGPAIGDYFEGGNADGDLDFVSGSTAPGFNDRVLPITRDELFRLVGRRVLGEIGGADDQATALPNDGLRRHHRDSGAFPWADGNGDGYADAGVGNGRVPYLDLQIPDWLDRNQWFTVVGYQRLSADTARLTLDATTISSTVCASASCP